MRKVVAWWANEKRTQKLDRTPSGYRVKERSLHPPSNYENLHLWHPNPSQDLRVCIHDFKSLYVGWINRLQSKWTYRRVYFIQSETTVEVGKGCHAGRYPRNCLSSISWDIGSVVAVKDLQIYSAYSKPKNVSRTVSWSSCVCPKNMSMRLSGDVVVLSWHWLAITWGEKRSTLISL